MVSFGIADRANLFGTATTSDERPLGHLKNATEVRSGKRDGVCPVVSKECFETSRYRAPHLFLLGNMSDLFEICSGSFVPMLCAMHNYIALLSACKLGTR